MRPTFILFISLMLLFSLAAQQAAAPVVMLHSSGKIRYQAADSKKKQKVLDGAVLKADGQLLMKPGSEAVLFYSSHFARVEAEPVLPLMAPFADVDPNEALLNFDLTFGDFVMAAVQTAASPDNNTAAWGGIKTSSKTGDGWGGIKTSSKTGDGWGGIKTSSKTGDGWGNIRTGSKTGDGWGGKGSSITAISPFGKFIPALATFHWSRPAGKPLFSFQIVDEMGSTVVATTTQDTSLQIDLSRPPFDSAKRYTWWVTTAGEKAYASNKVAIAFSTMDDLQAAKQEAIEAPLYQESAPAIQLSMEAIALERANLFQAADQAYQRARKVAPKNEFLRLMHAAFWLRNGNEEMASRAYRTKP